MQWITTTILIFIGGIYLYSLYRDDQKDRTIDFLRGIIREQELELAELQRLYSKVLNKKRGEHDSQG